MKFFSVAATKARKMDEMRPAYTANLGLATHREKGMGAGKRDLKEGGGRRGGLCFPLYISHELYAVRRGVKNLQETSEQLQFKERGIRWHNRISFENFSSTPRTIGFRNNRGQFVNFNPSCGKTKEFERSFSLLAPKPRTAWKSMPKVACNELVSCCRENG